MFAPLSLIFASDTHAAAVEHLTRGAIEAGRTRTRAGGIAEAALRAGRGEAARADAVTGGAKATGGARTLMGPSGVSKRVGKTIGCQKNQYINIFVMILDSNIEFFVLKKMNEYCHNLLMIFGGCCCLHPTRACLRCGRIAHAGV